MIEVIIHLMLGALAYIVARDAARYLERMVYWLFVVRNSYRPAVDFRIVLSQGDCSMPMLKPGTPETATLRFVDAGRNPPVPSPTLATPPVWSADKPSAVLAPAADGLSCVVNEAVGNTDLTDVTVSCTLSLPDVPTPITHTVLFTPTGSPAVDFIIDVTP